jgi:ATP-dependent protease ClpP protease subunit
MDANAAIAYGFVDQILSSEKPDKPEKAAKK